MNNLINIPMDTSIAAIITAAGSSSRIGVKKEYRLFENEADKEGKPLSVLGKAVLPFAECPLIETIVITVPRSQSLGENAARSSLPAYLFNAHAKPRILFVPGGSTRCGSVLNALTLLKNINPRYVLIHDGARPWIEPALIERVIDAMFKHEAVIPAVPLIDTPKEIDENGYIKRHLRRVHVGNAQTPQGFAFSDILYAHEKAALKEKAGELYTDDAEVWGEFIGDVFVVPGSPQNKKITFPEDLELLVSDNDYDENRLGA